MAAGNSKTFGWVRASALLVALACGGGQPPISAPPSTKPACSDPCRILPSVEDVANPRQCVADADCGSRAHAQDIICDHAGYCHPHCEDYWGDCNDDYRDGCETQIENRIYCKGDPRINQYFPPHVLVLSERRTSGPGRFDASAFDRGLEAQRARLQLCYERLLKTTPTVEGARCYEFTLHDTGRITRSKLIRNVTNSNETTSQALEACVSQFVAAVTYDDRPEGGPVAFEYCIEFIRGYFNTDDQTER